jgi:hypothetical protein
MEIVTFAIVIIAALFAIGSGVWVATALIRAISSRRAEHNTCHRPEGKSNGRDI